MEIIKLCLKNSLIQNCCNRTFCCICPRDLGALPNRYEKPDELFDEYQEWVKNQECVLDLMEPHQDFDGHTVLRRAIFDIAATRNLKYFQKPDKHGQENLLYAVADLYCKFINHDLDPHKNVLITNGVNQALYTAIMGFIQEGDEVVLVEPYKTVYERIVREAGGICRYVPLRHEPTVRSYNDPSLHNSYELKFDMTEVALTFNGCTKMVIINNPHMPIGRLFTCKDLELFANLCDIHNCICISDESLEYLMFDSNRMKRMSHFEDPCMWERTITVSSAGDVFNVPGINVAWMYGPKFLIDRAKHVQTLLNKGGHIPIQEALAYALDKDIDVLCADCGYMQSNYRMMVNKRAFIFRILRNAGFQPVVPQAGFYMVADWRPMTHKLNLDCFRDYHYGYRFAKWLACKVGIQGAPLVAFYSPDHRNMVQNYMVFNFMQSQCKLMRMEQLFENWKINYQRRTRAKVIR